MILLSLGPPESLNISEVDSEVITLASSSEPVTLDDYGNLKLLDQNGAIQASLSTGAVQSRFLTEMKDNLLFADYEGALYIVEKDLSAVIERRTDLGVASVIESIEPITDDLLLIGYTSGNIGTYSVNQNQTIALSPFLYGQPKNTLPIPGSNYALTMIGSKLLLFNQELEITAAGVLDEEVPFSKLQMLDANPDTITLLGSSGQRRSIR